MFIGMIAIIVGFSLLGSSKYISMIDLSVIIVSGMIIFGFGLSMVSIVVVPEILTTIE